MKKLFNGKYIDLTPAELASIADENARAEAAERKRPLTEGEIASMFVRQQINTLDVDDATAYRMKDYYPTWDELCGKSYTAEKAGFKFTYGGKLYKTVQAGYTFVTTWIPDNGTESLFERIDETHDGTKYDPIPYEGNMELVNGLYYSQDGAVYLCTRDTGTAVYNALSELVGIYVEVLT